MTLVPGRVLLQEHESRRVHRTVALEHRGVEGPSEIVDGEDVEPTVEHHGRQVLDRVQQHSDSGADGVLDRRLAAFAGLGGQGGEQSVQVGAFVVVKPGPVEVMDYNEAIARLQELRNARGKALVPRLLLGNGFRRTSCPRAEVAGAGHRVVAARWSVDGAGRGSRRPSRGRSSTVAAAQRTRGQRRDRRSALARGAIMPDRKRSQS